jgi:peptidyl-prolyl cis-trans isomerase A (cyclophilin A)
MNRRTALFLVAAAAAAACSMKTSAVRDDVPAEPAVAQPAAVQPVQGSTVPVKKELFAVLDTTQGIIEVRLLPLEAPRTVANFTELAEGKKEWTDPSAGQKVQRPLYDGTRFFRVIPGFVIQGGDPKNDGTGGPGYAFADELFPGRQFDRAGLLAMVNSGPDTNGSQFFITLAPLPWLNGKHTVFGEVVKGLEAAQALGVVPRDTVDEATGRPIDRPVEPQVLKSVRIEER